MAGFFLHSIVLSRESRHGFSFEREGSRRLLTHLRLYNAARICDNANRATIVKLIPPVITPQTGVRDSLNAEIAIMKTFELKLSSQNIMI